MDREKQNSAYEAEQIQILEGLEAVRRRPGIYIGSTDAESAPPRTEVVDNSITRPKTATPTW